MATTTPHRGSSWALYVLAFGLVLLITAGILSATTGGAISGALFAIGGFVCLIAVVIRWFRRPL